jgi:hypothetical protein
LASGKHPDDERKRLEQALILQGFTADQVEEALEIYDSNGIASMRGYYKDVIREQMLRDPNHPTWALVRRILN